MSLNLVIIGIIKTVNVYVGFFNFNFKLEWLSSLILRNLGINSKLLIEIFSVVIDFFSKILFSFSLLIQRRPTERGRIAVWLVSSLNRYDLTKEVDILECSETVESKLVKLETRRTRILPPMLIVFTAYLSFSLSKGCLNSWVALIISILRHGLGREFKPWWQQTLFQTQAQHLHFIHDSIWFIWLDTFICQSNLSCELWTENWK